MEEIKEGSAEDDSELPISLFLRREKAKKRERVREEEEAMWQWHP